MKLDKLLQLCAGVSAVLLSALFASHASAQQQIVRLVVGLPPGGNVDIVARLVAEKLHESLGQPVIVENRPGAQGRMSVQAVKNAAPDGTTLLVTPGAILYLYPHMFKQLGYDPFRDFAPISQLVSWDLGLAVPADSPSKNLSEFLAWAKANPKGAFFGSASIGSLQHFMGLSLAKEANTPLEHVGYKGGKEAVNALVGGHVQAVILNTGELIPLHEAGKVRILANFGSSRSPRLPDVPAVRELGFGGLGATGWVALYAPAGTPSAVAERFNGASVKALAAPDVRKKILQLGMEPTTGSPKQLDDLGRRELAKWRDVVKASGFSAD